MTRPNILMIQCDQLSARALNLYGGPVHTPNLERLAAEGVTFDNAICPAPTCSPSRASIVTGRYPHAHGVAHNVNRRDYPSFRPPVTEEGLKESDDTTEKRLSEAGYATYHVGKWHLSDDDLPYYPQMFREHIEYADAMQTVFAAVRTQPSETYMDWYGWALPAQQTEAYQKAVMQGKVSREFIRKVGRTTLSLENTFDVQVTDRAVDILKHTSSPFMLTCSLNAPHDPNVAPLPYYDLFEPYTLDLPVNMDNTDLRFEADLSRRLVKALGEVGVREFLRVYYALVRLVDDQVGRLLDALEEAGLTQQTLVIFVSDHGDMIGAHGMIWKNTSALFDEVVRVPLVIRLPQKVAPGRASFPVSLVDLFPTILEFAGVEGPAGRGVSLDSYLTGTGGTPGREWVACERLPWTETRTRAVAPDAPFDLLLRAEGWSYSRYADGDERLYDLAKDPFEKTNVAEHAAYASVITGCRARADRWSAPR